MRVAAIAEPQTLVLVLELDLLDELELDLLEETELEETERDLLDDIELKETELDRLEDIELDLLNEDAELDLLEEEIELDLLDEGTELDLLELTLDTPVPMVGIEHSFTALEGIGSTPKVSVLHTKVPFNTL